MQTIRVAYRPRAASQTHSYAFTLVEVLIAIAIIAILASLLLPSLIGGKERARRTAYVNNMRQFTLALHLYANDFSDFLPLGYSDDGERMMQQSPNGIFIDEHVPILSRNMRTNLLHYSGKNERPYPTAPSSSLMPRTVQS